MNPAEPSPPPDDDGFDVTLIDAALAMTPTERLERHEEALRAVRALQAAFAAQTDASAPRPR